MMVRKRGPTDRVEKVLKKTRRSNFTEETSEESPSKKDKNMLNDHILNLYKQQASSILNHSSSEKNEPSTSDSTDKQTENAASTSTSSRKSIKHVEKRKHSVFSVKHPSTRFKDVAGLDETLCKLMLKCFRIREPDLYSFFNEEKGDYIILSGPSGCGKTLAVHALAGDSGLPLLEVVATNLVSGISGESESRIRDIFEEAARIAPCILFIDRIDAIAPKIDPRDSKGMERRMVTQLLTSLDDFKENGHSSKVVVIIATNKVDTIDLDLLNRFDYQLAVKIPDEKARLMILQVLTKHLNLPSDFNLEWIAHNTPGYIGADLYRLVKQAFNLSMERLHMKCIDTHIDGEKLSFESDSNIADHSNSVSNLNKVLSFYWSDFKTPIEEAANIITLESFKEALKSIIPSSKREGFSTVPRVAWDDVGALDEVKEKMKECVIWPVKYRKMYDMFGFEASKGILLYGPKGCGKTLLAKVVANECSINFLSVKGPELLNMYLGESEKAVRQCFQRAKASAPCVIFFDEIDSLFPNRSGSSTNAAADRVVNQLLTLMDGMEERNEVFVMGATNRLEILDTAVLRPGRLDKVFYVGLPTAAGRTDILKSITKNKTKPKIADGVDLNVISHDQRCTNFSGADLAHLVRAASASAFRRCFTKMESTTSIPDEKMELTIEDFECAFTEVKASVTERDLGTFPQDTSIRI